MRKRMSLHAGLLLRVFPVFFCHVYFASAQVDFTLTGPGVDANDFRVTTFATGLNYPVGMSELSDGSILVAVSSGSSFFGSTSGQILRLSDPDLADT